MLKSLLILLFSLGSLTISFSQIPALVMSSRGIAYIADEKNQYFREIKIDFDSSIVYYREAVTKKYKEYVSDDNEKYIKFFKDSASIETIDSLIRSHTFTTKDGFKFQYKEDSQNYYPILTQSYEFGHPAEQDEYLERILTVYQKLKDEILASEKAEKKKKK